MGKLLCPLVFIQYDERKKHKTINWIRIASIEKDVCYPILLEKKNLNTVCPFQYS